MKPTETGQAYDQIADWWNDSMRSAAIGMPFLERAVGLCENTREALDVGCGGGRLVGPLLHAGFRATGIDVSEAQLKIARSRHPDVSFVLADICEWMPPVAYDLVVAWDSTFHVPHDQQGTVLIKLCNALAENGVILFTAGGIDGEISGTMQGVRFDYSSLAEEEYLRILHDMGCTCILLDRDQYPEVHIVMMAVKDKS